jgi:proteasome lid subunit RPN8/RPN11
MVAQIFSMLLLAAVAPDLTADPAARAFLWAMLAEARYGYSETEEAAFVVRDTDGRLTFVRWPEPGAQHQARWPGAFPAGTIAIVHTHPNHTPRPSRLDERAARRRGIPIYVLTRTKITRTTGGEAEVVIDGDWTTPARR